MRYIIDATDVTGRRGRIRQSAHDEAGLQFVLRKLQQYRYTNVEVQRLVSSVELRGVVHITSHQPYNEPYGRGKGYYSTTQCGKEYSQKQEREGDSRFRAADGTEYALAHLCVACSRLSGIPSRRLPPTPKRKAKGR